jgi:flagellar basal-body rod protein FlgB
VRLAPARNLRKKPGCNDKNAPRAKLETYERDCPVDEAIILSDNPSRLVAKMMEVTQQRHQVIANNLSNVNTPGYTRRDIAFREQLARLVREGNAADIDAFEPKLVEDRADPPRRDGNNVKGAREMNEMMQNSLMYELLAKAYNKRTSILKMATQGAPS